MFYHIFLSHVAVILMIIISPKDIGQTLLRPFHANAIAQDFLFDFNSNIWPNWVPLQDKPIRSERP